MTVSTATSRSGPYAGAGTTGPFTVNFRFLDASHLEVIKTDATGEHVLVLSTDYTVAGVGNPTGSVTLIAALPVGQTLTIIRAVPVTQEADYVQNDDFPAESHENVVDKLTMVCQQLDEASGRSLTLPASASSGVSTKLPLPESNKLIGWNAAADGLQNMDGSSLATIVGFGTAKADLFSGTGAQTAFSLGANPGAIANLDVSIGGVTQRPGSDYNWSSGTTLTFVVAPPAGINNVLARYMQALPQGVSDSAASQFIQAGAGAVQRTAQNKMREIVSGSDFGMDPTGATNSATAFLLALEACRQISNSGRFPQLELDAGKYLFTFAKGSANTNPFSSFATKSLYNFVPDDWPRNASEASPSGHGLTIRGKGNVQFLHDGDENSYLLSGAGGYFTLHLENITIRANSTARTLHGIAFEGLVYGIWKNVFFEDFTRGVGHYMPGCTGNSFYGYGGINCQRALVLGTDGAVDWGTALSNCNNFYNYNFNGNGQNLTDAQSLLIGAVEINATQDSHFENGIWQNNKGSLIIKACEGLTFRGAYNEYTNLTRPANTIYRNSIIVDTVHAAVLRSVPAGVVNYVCALKFEDCFVDNDFVMLIRAAAGKTIHGITFNNLTGYGQQKYGYVTAELPYITGITFQNSPQFTDAFKTATMSALPPQVSFDAVTGAILSQTNNRILPMASYNPGYTMAVVPNIRACSFGATMQANRVNVTGDGSMYTVNFGVFAFDGNGDFNTATNIFTAPVAGMYQFSGTVLLNNIGAGHTRGEAFLQVNAGYVQLFDCNAAAVKNLNGEMIFSYGTMQSLAAGATVSLIVRGTNSTKTMGVAGGTTFCGHLIT